MNTRTAVIVWSLVGAAAIQIVVSACGRGPHGSIDGGTQDASAAGSGALTQVVTADSDSNQLRRAAVTLQASAPAKLFEGPLVLTDISFSDEAIANSAAVEVAVFPSASACPSASSPPNTIAINNYTTISGASSPLAAVGALSVFGPSPVGGVAYVNLNIHGGRYIIHAGEMVCAITGDSSSFPISWAGFVPYQ